jgi:hypothetical protein
MRSVGEMIQVGVHILKTTVTAKTKKIVAQIGTVMGEGQAEADNVDWWQHVGFASRPAKAEKGRDAAQAIVIRRGHGDAAIASQDLRGLEIYGETCIYATGEDGTGQARVLLKKNGSINLYTKEGNTSGGTGMMFQLDAANGAIRAVNSLGYALIIDADGISLTCGSSALVLTPSGAKLISTGQTQVDGGGICLGSLAVPGINSALTGVTGVAGKASLKVLIE